MEKEILIKKVKAKLNQKKINLEVVEAGAKDWIAGIALSLTSLLSGIGDAGATSGDVMRYINKINKQVERDSKLKDHVKVSPVNNGKFKVEVGPYVMEGKFSPDFKKVDIDLKTDPKADSEDIKNWKPYVEEISREVEHNLNIDSQESMNKILNYKDMLENVEIKIYRFLEEEGVDKGGLYRSELAEYYSRNFDEFQKDYPGVKIDNHKEVQDYVDSMPSLKKKTDNFYKNHKG
jgi:hypothetical protein